MKHIFNFDTPPRLLSLHTIRNHVYGICGVEPYTRKNGKASFILTWVAACKRKDCRNFYLLKTGLRGTYLSKRCDFHRRGTKEQKARRIIKILQDYFATPPVR
jgi:hypothetical protein